MAGITYGLQLHRDAVADLEEVGKVDAGARSQIQVLLQEISGDEDLLDSLNIDGFDDGRFSVSPVWELQKSGVNGWQLKLQDLRFSDRVLPYRVLIAFDGPRRIYHVVAVHHRSTVYDEAIFERIARAYDGLGIARLPR